MRNHADRVLTENLIGNARLKDAFLETERDAKILRRARWFCGVSSLICATMILHHSFDLPALGYVWAFILSICT